MTDNLAETCFWIFFVLLMSCFGYAIGWQMGYEYKELRQFRCLNK